MRFSLFIFSILSMESLFAVGLTDEVKEAIRKAQDGNELPTPYTVTLLRNKTEPSQDVVLLGEPHVMSEKKQKMGLEIVRHFNFIGVEALRQPDFISNEDYLSISNLIHRAHQLAPLPEEEKAVRGLLHALSERDKEVLDKEVIKDSGAGIVNIFKFVIGYDYMPQKTLKFFEDFREIEDLSAEWPEVFYDLCDLGYPRDFPLTSDSIPSLMVDLRMQLADLPFDHFHLEYFSPSTPSVNRMANCYLDLKKTMNEKSDEFFDAFLKALKRIMVTHSGVDERDEVLAFGIVSSLKARPDYPKFLGIMGSFHISGVEKLLIEKYGFSRIELKDL